MRALVLTLLAGCGRFGFAADVGGDAAPADATPDEHPLDPICGTADADEDGVGDGCDPSDAIPHVVALFEPFDAPAAGWTTTGAGQWTVTAGGLHGMYTNTSASSYVSPQSFDPPLRVMTRYTIEDVDPGTANHTISAVDAFDLVTEDSQKCGQASPSNVSIGHERSGTTVDATSANFPDSLVEGATYLATFEHSPSTMRCTHDVPALGPSASVSVQHAPWRSSGHVGVRIRSIAATFDWLLVITPQP